MAWDAFSMEACMAMDAFCCRRIISLSWATSAEGWVVVGVGEETVERGEGEEQEESVGEAGAVLGRGGNAVESASWGWGECWGQCGLCLLLLSSREERRRAVG